MLSKFCSQTAAAFFTNLPFVGQENQAVGEFDNEEDDNEAVTDSETETE